MSRANPAPRVGQPGHQRSGAGVGRRLRLTGVPTRRRRAALLVHRMALRRGRGRSRGADREAGRHVQPVHHLGVPSRARRHAADHGIRPPARGPRGGSHGSLGPIDNRPIGLLSPLGSRRRPDRRSPVAAASSAPAASSTTPESMCKRSISGTGCGVRRTNRSWTSSVRSRGIIASMPSVCSTAPRLVRCGSTSTLVAWVCYHAATNLTQTRRHPRPLNAVLDALLLRCAHSGVAHRVACACGRDRGPGAMAARWTAWASATSVLLTTVSRRRRMARSRSPRKGESTAAEGDRV